ncbi:MAG TPA: MFS transporter [Patescibacteria group bacterium]|nr:MFS transporter [Patescibacteria group bacterium]
MRVDRNIRLLNFHAVCVNMAFVIPVIMPFYRDEIGLTFKDFLLGEACFAATVVLLDVPCGWISDQWRRKTVLALGTLLEMIGYGLLLVSHNLLMAALAQSVIGIGICLLNGTNAAILYESLMADGRESEYRKREGKRGGLGLYSVAFASTLGGLMYGVHHALPILLSLVMQCLGVMVACSLQEPERHRKRPEKHPVADIIETTRYALSHPEVGLLLIFAGVMFCSTKLIMWTQQPYYMAMGLREESFGLLMAVGFVIGGFSSQMGHRLDGRVGTYKALTLAWIAAVAACLGSSVHLGWQGIALLMMGGTCIYGMTAPRVSEAINRHVGSDRRATILSTQSLLVSLLFIPVSMLMGKVSDLWGVQAVLVALAGWLSVAGLCLAAWCIRRRQRARMLKVQAELLNVV